MKDEDNNFFSVPCLLDEYKSYVSNGDIKFLRKGQADVKKLLDDLIKVFGGKLKDGKLVVDKKGKFIEREGYNPDKKDWYKAHEIGRELWHKLASRALNNIDPNSKGNSKLFDYLDDATKFEDLLYGLDDYYRDHTLHSLWVYLLGESLLRKNLFNIHEGKLNWYLFNDLNFNLKCNKTDSVEHLSWGPIVKAFSRPII